MAGPGKRLLFDAAWALMGTALVGIVVYGSTLATADVGDRQTRNMIRLSLGWYAVALGLMMRLRPSDWRVVTLHGRIARWCWTWACLCFLIHLAMAFHYFHHWSHANAFEHTRQVSGVGEGVFVSYLFTLLWAADVAAWWLAPNRYATRSAWIDRGLHGFMLFVVFNGTVVYESGAIRWASSLGFVTLIVLWFTLRVRGAGGLVRRADV